MTQEQEQDQYVSGLIYLNLLVRVNFSLRANPSDQDIRGVQLFEFKHLWSHKIPLFWRFSVEKTQFNKVLSRLQNASNGQIYVGVIF